jgi:hypothetical protein
MGATAPHPSGKGGDTSSGFYQNAMQNAKQQVANVGQTQQAQAQPGQPPNAPGGTNSDSLAAYNNYMARVGPQNNQPFQRSASDSAPPPNYSAIFGGDWNTRAPGAPTTQASGNAPQAPGNPPPTQQRMRPGQKPPQGISMGPGYANRPFS